MLTTTAAKQANFFGEQAEELGSHSLAVKTEDVFDQIFDTNFFQFTDFTTAALISTPTPDATK
jgi:hypothetical protein